MGNRERRGNLSWKVRVTHPFPGPDCSSVTASCLCLSFLVWFRVPEKVVSREEEEQLCLLSLGWRKQKSDPQAVSDSQKGPSDLPYTLGGHRGTESWESGLEVPSPKLEEQQVQRQRDLPSRCPAAQPLQPFS